MTHITSMWARRYGLNDPAATAHEVYECDSAGIRSLGRLGAAAVVACDDATPLAARALTALRLGWSRGRPADGIALLRGLGGAVADTCRANTTTMDAFATAIDIAVRQVQRAYTEVETAIRASGLDVTPSEATVDELLLLERQRTAVVMVLDGKVRAAGDALDRAVDHVIGALGAVGSDPHSGIPEIPAAGHLSGDGARAVPPGSSGRVDEANRATLTADLRSGSRRHRVFAAAVQRALRHTEAKGCNVQLLQYDADSPPGQGGVTIAVGDVSHADSVAVLVPGVDHSPADASDTLDLAARLDRATGADTPGEASATVVYFGYDIPLSWAKDPLPEPVTGLVGRAVVDSVEALSARDAAAGGAGLATFTSRLRSMLSPGAGLTLIGHSYGSTVVSQAARRLDADTDVDDVVLLASPGAGYGLDSAADYPTVDADHVYTLAYPADPIAQPVTDALAGALDAVGGIGRAITSGADHGPFGVDPHSPGFGAQRIDAPSNVAASGFGPWSHLGQHALGNYLSGPGLRAVAAITAGRYSRVRTRSER
jgi:hypothetical protein